MFSLTDFWFSVVSFVLACIVCWISILSASEDITCRIRSNANIFSLCFPYMNRSDYICVWSIVFGLYAFRKLFSLHWNTWIFQGKKCYHQPFLCKKTECINFSAFSWNWHSALKLFVVWHVVEWCKFESEFTTLFWYKGAYLEAKNCHYYDLYISTVFYCRVVPCIIGTVYTFKNLP